MSSIVSRQDVKIIRPGLGLAPIEIDQVVGRKLLVNVSKGMATSWEQFR